MKKTLFQRRGLIALIPLLLTTSGAAVMATTGVASAGPGAQVVTANAPLTDLSPGTVDPTDGASGQFVGVGADGRGTRSLLILTGLDANAAGATFGAHVHRGPCVAGVPAAAGAHYNAGGAPSTATEVWLDFTVHPGGVAVAHSSVPFTIPAGQAASVVVHRLATDATGAAGPRMACLPVAF